MTMFSQYGETARLRKVIVGRVEGYRKVDEYTEIVNEDQRRGLPSADKLKREFNSFIKALEQRDIEVLIPEYVGKFVYDQLTPRDIGVAIGHKFVLCHMVKRSRRYEAAGIFPYISPIDEENEPNVLIPDSRHALLEGGDIMCDKNRIFVGVSQRTNQEGVEFLERQFSNEFEIIPVQCRSLEEGENVLHLDCTFNPVGEKHALIYPDGFKEIPDAIRDEYHWIEISREEQAQLATNVLSLDKHTVVSREDEICERVNREMEKAGIEVLRIPFDGAPATGGSFRCCSLPLVRERS